MPVSQEVMKLSCLVLLGAVVMYHDVRYRRIPNVVVLVMMLTGLVINTKFGGMHGLVVSGEGFGLAFLPMFLIHLFGALGAGDVKLFGAVGAVLGVEMVPATFVVVVMLGAALAVYSMLRSRTVFSTLHGVLRIFVGMLPGWEMPRFAVPADRRHTIPYGVAIMVGSVLSTVFLRT